MTPVELAWAAGLFEGEGTIRISGRYQGNLGSLVVSVVNTDHEVTAYFQTRWRGRLRLATGLRSDQRPAMVWVIAARQALVFIYAVLPYLQTVRVIEKALLAIEYQEQKSRTRAVFLSEEYRMWQWGYFMHMKELNVRGNK